MKYTLVVFFSYMTAIPVFGQTKLTIHSGIFQAGYKNIITVDTGRTYKPGTHKTDRLFYRPEEIDIWYPANHVKPADLMPYGAFLRLLEERSNRFQDDTIYRSIRSDLVQYLSSNLKIQDTSKLTNLKTRSYQNADAIDQRFPLIIYMSAFNGMSYENIKLFEFLAEHGYVVACITSVGRYPGNMSTRMADLLEQTNDGLFAVNFLKSCNKIDSAKIGTIGYSWGGLAAFALAIKNPEIKAVLSFDGSEMHYYGESGEEDRNFDEFRTSYLFKPENLQVPYVYLESGFKQTDRDVDSIFNALPLLEHPHMYVRFPKAEHEDFSSIPYLFPSSKDSQNLYSQFCQFSLDYFDQYLKDRSPAYPRQLTMLYQHQIADSVYPIINHVLRPQFILKGIVMDSESRQALAYVNVGIPDENTGTVSQRDGSFKLNIHTDLESDSLRFSMVGYSSVSFSIIDLKKQSFPLVITLKHNIRELKEVVVTQKLLPVKILGNTTTTRFVNVGLPLKFLGSEIGVKINLGSKPVLLKNFNFNISDTRLDTAVFRLNIYHFKNGTPLANILRENILIPVGKKPGLYTVNLSPYKLILNDDILVSIEWIEGSASGKENGALFLSASFLSSATWHRLTSQGKWKKASGLGVGFNLEVQKILKQPANE